MKISLGNRLLALLLVLVMLVAMVPASLAAEEGGGGADTEQGEGGETEPEKPEVPTPTVIDNIALNHDTMTLKVGEKGTSPSSWRTVRATRSIRFQMALLWNGRAMQRMRYGC